MEKGPVVQTTNNKKCAFIGLKRGERKIKPNCNLPNNIGKLTPQR